MANGGARAYNGGLGAEPLVRGQGPKPPEAENLLKYWTSNKMEKWAPFHFFQRFTDCLYHGAVVNK